LNLLINHNFFAKEGEYTMTPRNLIDIEPDDNDSIYPFGEPRTIPMGWEVSAFFAPERENLKQYNGLNNPFIYAPASHRSNENTENTL
jgi:hypothetical protein